MLPADIAADLQAVLECTLSPAVRSVGGGSIHTALRVETSRGTVFLKYGQSAVAAQLDAECEGLRELARAQAIRTPAAIVSRQTATHAYAVFEWIEFGANSAASDTRLGEQLAQLHRTTCDHFGWHRDNFIGSTPQLNPKRGNWIEFWQEARLTYQLDCARANGAHARLIDLGARLVALVPGFFTGYTPLPSLIHGDLWNGNYAVDRAGHPVIFDPAVYYADREAELAMTRLFGGFGKDCYRAYESAWPLAAGADTRCLLYQLYHVLNHFNLFGGAYHAQAERLIARLLAEAQA
ncbi:MAG: fructosamine kinase family protein [Steroidobacteraceae bacterium]